MRWAAAIVLLASPLAAHATESEAVALLRATLTEAHAIGAREGERRERLAALHAVARTLVDTRAMGRRAIGEGLDAASPADQEEFLTLFDELLVRSYLQKLLFFRAPRFAIGKATARGDAVVVHTKILTRKDEFHVDYEMQRREAGWRATDIVIEHMSLRDTYTAQFQSLLRDRSFAELLALMHRKVHGLRGRR